MDAYDWGFCQIQYNYMDENHQAGRKGLEYAASKGLGVIIMEPLRGGQLVQRIPEPIQAIWDKAEIRQSPAEWALRWVWNHPEVSLLLSGMKALEEVEENCHIADLSTPNSLTSSELELLQRVKGAYEERLKSPCTACGYCQPCPQGVLIPRIFTLYNEVHMYGALESPRRIYNHILTPTDRASNCVECGKCEQACPQQLPIISTLKESHHLLSAE